MPPRLLARRRPRGGRCRVQQRVDRRPRQRVRAAVATRWHSAGRRSARGRGTWSRVRAQPAAPAGQRPAATGRGGDASGPGNTGRRARRSRRAHRLPTASASRWRRAARQARVPHRAGLPRRRRWRGPGTSRPPGSRRLLPHLPAHTAAPHGIAQGTEALHGHAGQPADVTPTGAARTAPDVTPGSAPGAPPPVRSAWHRAGHRRPPRPRRPTRRRHTHRRRPHRARRHPRLRARRTAHPLLVLLRMASPRAPKASTATPANPPTSHRPARAATRPTSPPDIPAKART